MLVHSLQVEEPQQWRVRPELPPPPPGSLPLPRGGLPRLSSAFVPWHVEDLSRLAAAAGGPPLSTPEPCGKVGQLKSLEQLAAARMEPFEKVFASLSTFS